MPTKRIGIGDGRPNDWLREKCRELVHRGKIVEFLASVANGENLEQAVGNEGEIISIPASVRDRIKATEVLLDRGFGKADQAIDMKFTDATQRPTKEQLETALAVVRASSASRAGLAKDK